MLIGCWVKISADILKYFLIFPENRLTLKFQSLFSGETKKSVMNLPSAEFAQRLIKVDTYYDEL